MKCLFFKKFSYEKLLKHNISVFLKKKIFLMHFFFGKKNKLKISAHLLMGHQENFKLLSSWAYFLLGPAVFSYDCQWAYFVLDPIRRFYITIDNFSILPF